MALTSHQRSTNGNKTVFGNILRDFARIMWPNVALEDNQLAITGSLRDNKLTGRQPTEMKDKSAGCLVL